MCQCQDHEPQDNPGPANFQLMLNSTYTTRKSDCPCANTHMESFEENDELLSSNP